MKLATRGLIAAAVALGATAASGLAPAAGGGPAHALGPGPATAVITIDHSRFVPADITVVAGTTVRFVVENDDPINHELIVGPPEVHARHEDGTESSHPPVPGEVSVGAGERAVTSYSFDRVGTVEMACHLPGHYDYGMRGTVTVVEAD